MTWKPLEFSVGDEVVRDTEDGQQWGRVVEVDARRGLARVEPGGHWLAPDGYPRHGLVLELGAPWRIASARDCEQRDCAAIRERWQRAQSDFGETDWLGYASLVRGWDFPNAGSDHFEREHWERLAQWLDDREAGEVKGND
jgi:hypothetical protein